MKTRTNLRQKLARRVEKLLHDNYLKLGVLEFDDLVLPLMYLNDSEKYEKF